MQKKRRYPFATRLALLAAVAIPTVMRHQSGALEPYPALLLPVGAAVVARFDDNVVLQLDRPFVETSHGDRTPLDVHALLPEFPRSHRLALARAGFGLTSVHGGDQSKPEHRELSEWYRTRLKRMGHTDVESIVKIRNRIVVSIPTGRTVNRVVMNEQRLELPR